MAKRNEIIIDSVGTAEITLSTPRRQAVDLDVTSGGNIDHDEYIGPYTVTPTQETQTLKTKSKVLVKDVTVNPIPPNYGLITWDGSILTVS